MSASRLIQVAVLLCLAIGYCTHSTALAVQNDVVVCMTSDKEAPLYGKRDLHVWIRNNATQSLAGLTLRFYIQGKGTTNHAIASLQPGVIHQVTRNHSWATAGDRRLVATVEGVGKAAVTVEGRIGIHVIKPAYQSEKLVVCSNGKRLSEAEIPHGMTDSTLGTPPMNLNLSVCVSAGKNPPVGHARDIHAWVGNRGAKPVSDLTLKFFVEGKETETHPLPTLAPGQVVKTTRHHAWASPGRKTINAVVLWPDGVSYTRADGSFKVSPLGAPTQSAPHSVTCADGTLTTEADM